VQGVSSCLSENLLDILLGRWYAIAMNKKLSAAKQKRAKTYYRNLLIKTLHSQGKSEAGDRAVVWIESPENIPDTTTK